MRLALSSLIDVVAFCDPASGKQGADRIKKTRARSAIVVIGQDHLTRIFVLYAWAERCSTDALIDKMIEVNDQWKPRIFGGEAAGLQSLFQDAIIREARHRNIRLPLYPWPQPTNIDKDFRIRTALQQPIRYGRLFVQGQHVELTKELRGFPRDKLKDLVDALASAVTILPGVPTRRQSDDEVEALAANLRATGADPAYIVQRCEEVRRLRAA